MTPPPYPTPSLALRISTNRDALPTPIGCFLKERLCNRKGGFTFLLVSLFFFFSFKGGMNKLNADG
jgi:hypothetical protein